MTKLKQIMKFTVCMFLIFSLFVTNVKAADNDSITMNTNYQDNINVVEMYEGDSLFRATYDKTEQTLLLEQIVNDEVINWTYIDAVSMTIEADVQQVQLATPVQSETGFGYLVDRPLNSYACSEKLVEDGVYGYRGFNIYYATLENEQNRFRDKVDELILLEAELEEVSTYRTVALVVGAILFAIGSGASSAFGIAALGLQADAMVVANKIDAASRICASLYGTLIEEQIDVII